MKIVFHLLFIFLVTLLEKTELLGKIFLTPTLCFVIFFSTFKNKISLLWPILGGLFLDIFSIFKIPIFTISFLLTFLIINFANEKIFTTKNFLSFIIFSAGGVILYNLIFLIINFIAYLLKIDQFFISFNSKYFLSIFSNTVFTLFLLSAFRKKI